MISDWPKGGHPQYQKLARRASGICGGYSQTCSFRPYEGPIDSLLSTMCRSLWVALVLPLIPLASCTSCADEAFATFKPCLPLLAAFNGLIDLQSPHPVPKEQLEGLKANVTIPPACCEAGQRFYKQTDWSRCSCDPAMLALMHASMTPCGYDAVVTVSAALCNAEIALGGMEGCPSEPKCT